jgi:hypothetical protein
MIGYSLILILLVVLVIAGCKTSRAGYESAPYRVVRTAGQFEVRDYPPLTVVETPMQGRDSGMNGSFNRLFKFITGGNETKQNCKYWTSLCWIAAARARNVQPTGWPFFPKPQFSGRFARSTRRQATKIPSGTSLEAESVNT